MSRISLFVFGLLCAGFAFAEAPGSGGPYTVNCNKANKDNPPPLFGLPYIEIQNGVPPGFAEEAGKMCAGRRPARRLRQTRVR